MLSAIKMKPLRIGAMLLACVLLGHSGAAAAKEINLSYEHLWESFVLIGSHPSWIDGEKEMTIAPRLRHGRIVVPPNFVVALRDLDTMLPKSFTEKVSADAFPGKCLKNPSKNVLLLHSFLTNMLYFKWFFDGSRLSAFVDRKYAGPSLHYDKRQAARFRQLKTAWLLCNYYSWKRQGSLPADSELASDLQNYAREQIPR